jgi:hypothetical protein
MLAGVGLAEELIEAHGGLERWQAARRATVVFSAGGPALASKLRPFALRSVAVSVPTALPPRAVLDPFPSAGLRGQLEPGVVRIVDGATGRARAERAVPGGHAGLAARRRWDDLDLLRFAAGAMWTYLALPFVLAWPEVAAREVEPCDEAGERWRRLEVTFPEGWPTHCRVQTLHLDAGLRIRRHDYTAEAFGPWARAAHYLDRWCDFDGFWVPTRRRVFPRRADGHRRAGPLLLWIDVITAFLIPAGPG